MIRHSKTKVAMWGSYLTLLFKGMIDYDFTFLTLVSVVMLLIYKQHLQSYNTQSKGRYFILQRMAGRTTLKLALTPPPGTWFIDYNDRKC